MSCINKNTIRSTIATLINSILKGCNIFVIFRLSGGIGDFFTMTAVIEKIASYYPKYKIIVCSIYPEIFRNNPYIWLNIPIQDNNKIFITLIRRILFVSRNTEHVKEYIFTHQTYTYEYFMKQFQVSIITAYTQHFNIGINFEGITPNIFFTSEEINLYMRKFQYLFNNNKPFAIIQPNSKNEYSKNKYWDFKKYQKVVYILNDIKWVQTGTTAEKKLDDVLDLRGKTNLRELAFLIKKARFVLCPEGAYNHIASAVKTKAIVIFTGFTHINIAKYPTTVPVFAKPMPECAPCWEVKKCPQKHYRCSENISVMQVVKTIRQNIAPTNHR